MEFDLTLFLLWYGSSTLHFWEKLDVSLPHSRTILKAPSGALSVVTNAKLCRGLRPKYEYTRDVL